MFQLAKYTFFDMIRNKWLHVYLGSFLILTFALLLLSNDHTNVIISLTNIVLTLVPLASILVGTMYFYQFKSYIELILTQPISRTSIAFGLFAGIAMSLSIGLIIGIVLPMGIFGIFYSPQLAVFFLLLFISLVLTNVFLLIGLCIALKFDNKITGFGLSIFVWLFFILFYDGIFLLLLLLFKEYPLEKFSIAMILLNPIDLARILILLKLDISAMMGYTGAVLQKFLGTGYSALTVFIALLIWMALPFSWMISLYKRKDF